MVKNIKGIMSGILFIIIATLIVQLLFILMSVGYNNISNDFPFLKEIRSVLKFLFGVPILAMIMFWGGYITTIIAESASIMNSLIVSIAVTGGMMWPALTNAELTITGVVISTCIVLVIILGGLSAGKTIQSPPS